MRFQKCVCNTTGINVIKPLCRIRSTSWTSQNLNMGFEIVKNVEKISGMFRVLLKAGGNWRSLISLSGIDVCLLLSGVNGIPYLKGLKNLVFEQFPNLPQKCPLKPGKYYTYNSTVHNYTGNELNKLLTNTPLPNGVYRLFGRAYTDIDKIGASIWCHIEIYERLNDEVF